MGKTSFLELNSMNISNSSAKEVIVNEFEEYFFFLLQDLLSQTSFGYISIKFSTIPMVSMAPKSP